MNNPCDAPLVADSGSIRLAMIGMVEGNGHPLSWSAIINGKYDRSIIQAAGYPGICDYLDRQAPDQLGMEGVRVTHVCCDRPEQSREVAASAGIPFIVDKPENVIGQVDAVVIATDIGHEHVQRAKPFVEAGVPLFIDKPLTDNAEDLRQFIQWHRQGKAIMSSSCMRYAEEFIQLRERIVDVGELRIITGLMAKSWERYGIHAIEAIYHFLPVGGYEWVSNSSDWPDNTVHLHHASGVDVLLLVRPDLYGSFGQVELIGTQGVIGTKFSDTFTAFKSQLQAFVTYLRTGRKSIPFDETVEQMAIVIAGIESRKRSGGRVMLSVYSPENI